MKKSILFFLFIPYLCFSQNRNSVWVFGDSAGIDFSNLSNPIPFSSGMDGRGSCASIADTNGALLFSAFTNATSDWSTLVKTSIHSNMLNGDLITGAAWYNELVIVPRDSNKYFLVSYGSDVPNNEGLYYSIVEMNLNSGLGAVTIKNIQINPNRIADCITAVKHGNGRDWWVIAKLSDASISFHNRFFKYLITEDSIIDYSFQDFNDARDGDAQKIIWNSSYDKFMNINVGGYMSEFGFDRCDGSISLIRNIFTEQSSNYNRLFWDGAYSPSGNVFYVSTKFWFGVDSIYLLQLDLNSANIQGTMDTLDLALPPVHNAAVRLAPDNKIYFTRWYLCNSPQFYCFPYPDSVRNIYNENLSVVNSPDSLGSACNFQSYSFYLGGKRTYLGLPNNPKYDLGTLQGSSCDTLSVNIITYSKQNNIIAFPNPFKDKIKFDYGDRSNFNISINDVTGKSVFVTVRQDKSEIDLSFLQDGFYIVTLTTDKGIYQTKIIKQ